MTEEIQRLVERIEAASGPDRELDAVIWAFAHGGYIEPSGLGRPVVWHEDKGWAKHPVALGDGIWRERKLLGAASDAPRYTGSIDAVRTLIDPSDEWELSTIYNIARATVGLNRDGHYSLDIPRYKT